MKHESYLKNEIRKKDKERIDNYPKKEKKNPLQPLLLSITWRLGGKTSVYCSIYSMLKLERKQTTMINVKFLNLLYFRTLHNSSNNFLKEIVTYNRNSVMPEHLLQVKNKQIRGIK